MGSNENPAPQHETPTFGNPDLPQEGMVNTAGDPASTTMTGPRNPVGAHDGGQVPGHDPQPTGTRAP